MSSARKIISPFSGTWEQTINPFHGSVANPGGYFWNAVGVKEDVFKNKVPKETPEELALKRAQLSALGAQDDEINAKKLRLIRGQSSNFSSLLKSGLPTQEVLTTRSRQPVPSRGSAT